MENIYNTVGCSNCQYCCAYTHAGNPYCASESECNGPNGTSLALSVVISLLSVLVFGVILVACYYLGRDRVFDVESENIKQQKVTVQPTGYYENNNKIKEFKIEDQQVLPSTERRFNTRTR